MNITSLENSVILLVVFAIKAAVVSPLSRQDGSSQPVCGEDLGLISGYQNGIM